ncbi:MAG: cytochrome-c peroxidase, partial [Planctomycetota bacterium]
MRSVALVLLSTASLAACSHGSSGGGGAALAPLNGAPPTAPVPPPPPPPLPPPPGGAPLTLDQDLRARLQQANIATPPALAQPPQALVDLGRALFFDKILSGNRNVSCATCHAPEKGTGDALSLSLGQDKTTKIGRNAPPVYGLGGPREVFQFRDGRVARDPATGAFTTPEPVLNGPTPTRSDLAQPLGSALAAQALFPVASAAEMRGNPGQNELADAPDNVTVWARIMARLSAIPAYVTLFQAAFPGVASFSQLNFSHAANAIAAFEQASFATFATPLDRYLAGDTAALSDTAKRGGILFAGRVGCARCHGGPLLSDQNFHALAVPQLGPGVEGETDDRGRALATKDTRDNYRFRTPPLRNVALTGPFMHDGAFTTLQRVLRHYRNPGQSLQGYTGAELAPELQPTVDRDPA